MGHCTGRILYCVITIVSRKSAHGQNTLLTSLPKRLFRLFPHLTTKERPRRDLKPSKQIIGHKKSTTESPAASKSSPDGIQHSERHGVMVNIV